MEILLQEIAKSAHKVFESCAEASHASFPSQMKNALAGASHFHLLPLLDTFRTLNWVAIQKEIELSGILALFSNQMTSELKLT